MAILLYNDVNNYNRIKSLENDYLQIVEKIKLIITQNIGAEFEIDFVQLTENATEYIIQNYWNVLAVNFNPPHLNRQLVFERDTNIKVSQIDNLQIELNKIELGKHKPKVVCNAIISTIEKKQFDVYVNPKKEKEYKIIERFIKSISEMQKTFGANGVSHIQRFANGTLLTKGLEVVPNPTKFM